MGKPAMIGADAAREVIDYVRNQRGKPALPPDVQRARWPLGAGDSSVSIVRSTSATANANGYSPGFVESWDSTNKAWTDGQACQILDLVGLTLNPGRYLAIAEAATADGTPTFLAVDVMDVQYDDSTGLVSYVLGLELKKQDFVLTSPVANVALVATKGMTTAGGSVVGPFVTDVT